MNTEYIEELSVIVPIYKAGDYLHQCLLSLNNSYLLCMSRNKKSIQAVEIVLVFDGEKSSSYKIPELSDGIDIKIIENLNTIGAAASRNKGVAECLYDNIVFVDADDEVDICYFDVVFQAPRSESVVIGGFKKKKGSKFGPCIFPSKDYTNIDWLNHYLRGGFIQPGAIIWTKCFFNRIGRWNESLRRSDDTELMIRAFMKSDSPPKCLQVILIHYRQHASITRLTRESHLSLVKTADLILSELYAYGINKIDSVALSSFCYEISKTCYRAYDDENGKRFYNEAVLFHNKDVSARPIFKFLDYFFGFKNRELMVRYIKKLISKKLKKLIN